MQSSFLHPARTDETERVNGYEFRLRLILRRKRRSLASHPFRFRAREGTIERWRGYVLTIVAASIGGLVFGTAMMVLDDLS
jgi:hypothetical protein